MAIIKTYSTDIATSTISATVLVDTETVAVISNISNESTFQAKLLSIDNTTNTKLYYNGTDLVPLPDNPDPKFKWDWATYTWKDTRSLEEAKAACWAKIKEARELALTSPLTTPYGIFDAGRDSQKAITDSIMMLQTLESLGTPSTIDFTTATNVGVTLTTQQMVHIGLLLGQRTQTIFTIGRDLRVQIDQATTNEEVNAIVWPT